MNDRDKVIARWESKSGKHWVDLYSHGNRAYSYTAPGMGGNFFSHRDEEAVEYMIARVDQGLFQPDANKTPMKRVK